MALTNLQSCASVFEGRLRKKKNNDKINKTLQGSQNGKCNTLSNTYNINFCETKLTKDLLYQVHKVLT